MEHRRRVVTVLAVLAATIALDQLTKLVARSLLAGRRPIVLLGDLFRFEFAENPGAILSLGGNLPPELRFWIFTVLVAALLGVILVAALGRFRLERLEILGLAVIAGGGFSNLGDRIFNEGHVVDFMNMGIGSLRTGVFNIADIAILAGAALVIAGGIGARRRRRGAGETS